MEKDKKLKEIAETYAEQSGNKKGRQDLFDGFVDGYNQCIKEQTYNSDELYSEIEDAIIRWNIDGYKTAGYLTREIIKILNK